jgi:tetratricopeptide (TPR) repeat protein
MSEDSRIQRFEQMTAADPENELGHFSLGKAYLEAGRFEEAAGALSRTIELNPRMSKAFHLLGEAYEKAGRRDEAIDVMTRGVPIADKLGDRMPRDAMADSLHRLGAPVPEFQEAAGTPATDSDTGPSVAGFQCARCGRPGGQLAKPPFKGALGEKVYANSCNSCWREWIPMGTKVINELGLTLSTKDGQDTYDHYMIEFLQLEER